MVLFNVVEDTEAGSAGASSLELVDAEVPVGESDGDALYALWCTPLVPRPDSLYGASPHPPQLRWWLAVLTCILILDILLNQNSLGDCGPLWRQPTANN